MRLNLNPSPLTFPLGVLMAKISKDMTFNDVLRKYPDSVKVFKKYGMNCFGCMGADAESLEYGATAHGVDIKSLLRDLNKALQS